MKKSPISGFTPSKYIILLKYSAVILETVGLALQSLHAAARRDENETASIIYGLIMTDKTTSTDLSIWLSTYGMLTANRILERFNIRLDNDELVQALKDPLSIYHQLLIVPLKNVFNGIILQQAQAYQLYAQKLLIDYLLSGESGVDEAMPGANTRDDLEQERLKIMALDEQFSQLELAHQQLISESQAVLIQLSKNLQSKLKTTSGKIGQILRENNFSKEDALIQKAIRKAMIRHAAINNDSLALQSNFWEEMAGVLATPLSDLLRQKMAEILIVFGDPRQEIQETLLSHEERTADIRINLRSYRRQFYDIILKSTELLNLLPDYRVNKTQVELNRSSLQFDPNIGGN